jgi:hypothetical protein
MTLKRGLSNPLNALRHPYSSVTPRLLKNFPTFQSFSFYLEARLRGGNFELIQLVFSFRVAPFCGASDNILQLKTHVKPFYGENAPILANSSNSFF